MEILRAAIEETEIGDIIDAEFVQQAVFDAKNPSGLYGLFQHAVHLITVDRFELRTSPENFNFIFKHYSDNDLYELLYTLLPALLLVMSRSHEAVGSARQEGVRGAIEVWLLSGRGQPTL